jgi:hypothetical protein
MKSILKIGSNVNVMPLTLQLRRNPELWNQHNSRTVGGDTPHLEVDDIWARYSPPLSDPSVPHDSVWYPAYGKLPALREIVFGVMGLVQGEKLGGVLITRIPAGHSVKPHVDEGWHANYYDKFAVQVESHQQQAFHYHDGALVTAPGDIYWFNNQDTHWVTNDSPVDRITLIICIKVDKS